jgi:glycerophosphoryl diester phosphodiesterase
MTLIFAHRAIFKNKENSIEGIEHYKKEKINVELDLRLGSEGIFLSHDRNITDQTFEEACKILSNSEITCALHIKQKDVVTEAIRIIEKYNLKKYFLLATIDDILFPSNVKQENIANYVNRKPKDYSNKLLWCDETIGEWYSQENINTLHNKKNIIITMSREFIKESNTIEMYEEWKRLLSFKIDGICTEYPLELRDYLEKGEL